MLISIYPVHPVLQLGAMQVEMRVTVDSVLYTLTSIGDSFGVGFVKAY